MEEDDKSPGVIKDDKSPSVITTITMVVGMIAVLESNNNVSISCCPALI
jgi:hypothetical protein